MKSGIYKITNQINGKCYIGESVNIENRWRQHRQASTWEIKSNPLYNAFKKYALDNFKFEVLMEECEDHKQRLYLELMFKRKYKSHIDENGYNLIYGLETGHAGMSLAKATYQYNLNGSFIQEFKSLAEAGRQLGVSHEKIGQACNGKSRTSIGFQWSYDKCDNIGAAKLPGKLVNQYDLKGNFIKQYSSASVAAKEVGGGQSNISAVCRGKRRTCVGFTWKFVTEV